MEHTSDSAVSAAAEALSSTASKPEGETVRDDIRVCLNGGLTLFFAFCFSGTMTSFSKKITLICWADRNLSSKQK